MNPYAFCVSLRAQHPSKDIAFLSELFGMERRHGWKVGDVVKLLDGTSLGRFRMQSYWTAEITPDLVASEPQPLDAVIAQSVGDVLKHRDSLSDFYATGGRFNYFVGLYGMQNYGLIFSPELMQQLATAKIELQLDIYPEEPWADNGLPAS